MQKPKYNRPQWLPRTKKKPRVNDKYYKSAWWKNKKIEFWSLPSSQVCKGILPNGNRCMKVKGRYFQVDHITPLPHDITFNEFMAYSTDDNLQALCASCHARKTREEQ